MVGRAAMASLVVIFLTGAWLIAAPFALRFQPAGAPWTGAARMDVLVGAGLAVAPSPASSWRWPAGSGKCTPPARSKVRTL